MPFSEEDSRRLDKIKGRADSFDELPAVTPNIKTKQAKREVQAYDPDGRILLDVAVQGRIAFILVEFLRDLARRRKLLPRRQELPAGSYVEGSEELTRKYLPKVICENGKQSLKPANRQLWVVSHAWLTAEHPDPTGERVQELVRTLDALRADGRDAVFIDFPSLPQIDKMHVDYIYGEMLPDGHAALKTPEESASFAIAMQHMDKLYATAVARVIVMPTIYSSPIGERPGGRPFTLNARPYSARGWCIVELCVSSQFQRIANHKDAPKNPVQGVDPAAFQKAVEVGHIGFTSQRDADTVLAMFKRYYFAGRAGLLCNAIRDGNAIVYLDGVQSAMRCLRSQVRLRMVLEIAKRDDTCQLFAKDLIERLGEDYDGEVLKTAAGALAKITAEQRAEALKTIFKRAKMNEQHRQAAAVAVCTVVPCPALSRHERGAAAVALHALAGHWKVWEVSADSLGCIAVDLAVARRGRAAAVASLGLQVAAGYNPPIREAAGAALGRVAAELALPSEERAAAVDALHASDRNPHGQWQAAAKSWAEAATAAGTYDEGLVALRKLAQDSDDSVKKAVDLLGCAMMQKSGGQDSPSDSRYVRVKDPPPAEVVAEAVALHTQARDSDGALSKAAARRLAKLAGSGKQPLSVRASMAAVLLSLQSGGAMLGNTEQVRQAAYEAMRSEGLTKFNLLWLTRNMLIVKKAMVKAWVEVLASEGLLAQRVAAGAEALHTLAQDSDKGMSKAVASTVAEATINEALPLSMRGSMAAVLLSLQSELVMLNNTQQMRQAASEAMQEVGLTRDDLRERTMEMLSRQKVISL